MQTRLEKALHCIESTVPELIRNIKTPTSLEELRTARYEDSLELDIIDRSLRISVARWGTVYGYEQEQMGASVQNLFPIRKNETDQISSSSRVELEMHTEAAFHPYRADTVCLLCVREDENAGTVYATLEDILDEIADPSIVVNLHLPMYATQIDESFLGKDSANKEITTAVLYDNASRMVYDRALMRPLNRLAEEALNVFSRAIDKCKKTIYLKTGELFVMNNHTVVHGRTPFTPRYDGTDRWLKRALVVHRDVPQEHRAISPIGSRVITTKFEDF